jgi:hypothetical protein
VSLVLWLAVNVTWFHSHSIQTVFSCACNGRLVRVHFKENGVVLAVIHGWPTHEGLSLRSGPTGAAGFGIPILFDGARFQRGFLLPGILKEWGNGTAGSAAIPVSGWDVVVPWPWLQAIASFLCIPVCIRLLQLHRYQRRQTRGLCPLCGYDLRATPDRCPECGSVPNGM